MSGCWTHLEPGVPEPTFPNRTKNKKQKTKVSLKAGPPPLEAILVIFGRRALIFFVWKVLEKMKNDTTFVRMRSGDHLGDAKMSKKSTSLRRI